MEKLESYYTLPDCLNRTFSCSCGKIHRAELKAAVIGKNVLEKLPVWLHKNNYRKVYLVCDRVTVDIAGKKAQAYMEDAGIDVQLQVITHAAYDEMTVGELLIHMSRDRDVVIGVGTGSINDMCRYFSYKCDKPYGIVATAAPMDGFASGISALTVDNLKTTFAVRAPELIVGDTEILKNAPCAMNSAGLGDLIGKFTCLCDWKLSHRITGEYYCGSITDMVSKCSKNVLDHAGRVKERDPKVLGHIMEGLVFTGVAMSMVGNSRPASGCEHHISHYWETIFEQRGDRPAPHGHQVGVGTILILKLTEELLRMERIDFENARKAAKLYDPEVWKKEIRRAYGPAAQGVIKIEEEAQKNETGRRLKRIDYMEKHWKELTELLRELPSSGRIIELMTEMEAPCLPGQIGVDADLLRDTLVYCKEIRARYTILQMLWDLELLRPLTERLVEEIF